MRNFLAILAVVPLLMLGSPVFAQSGAGSIGGFGGLTFGSVASNTSFGGDVAVNLTPNIQAIGEVGRITDLMPSAIDRLLSLTPIGVRTSAWYGEGGVRFLASPHSHITPYAEATAGVARLQTNTAGLGDVGVITNAVLGYLNRTEPMLGVGAGTLIHAGPIGIDLGYRYKRIRSGNSIDSLLSGGGPIGVNQVRLGFNVRF